MRGRRLFAAVVVLVGIQNVAAYRRGGLEQLLAWWPMGATTAAVLAGWAAAALLRARSGRSVG